MALSLAELADTFALCTDIN